MTPKEKAKELIQKYEFIENFNYTSEYVAHECALIAVDEIMNYLAIIEQNADFAFGGSYNGDVYYIYWNKVKSEIKLLWPK